MKEGWSEAETADLMDTYLKDHGVKNFFHKSFAWFGERSGFYQFNKYSDFKPSSRQLKSSDVVILDTAPIVNDYVADIGYTFCLEKNKQLEKAKKLLLNLRNKIPQLFESNMTTKEIWEYVDKQITDSGFFNSHAQYPFSVLGHRVFKVPLSSLPLGNLPIGVYGYFSIHSYLGFITKRIFPQLLSPDSNCDKNGLWAIEPHIGCPDFGAKFEEILVVNDNKAYWLDQDVPHMKGETSWTGLLSQEQQQVSEKPLQKGT